MKHFLIVLFTVCAIAESASAAATDTVKIKTQIYCDHCKQCGSCWPRMEKELTFTPGVKSLSFDEKIMIITVGYNPKKTSAEQIRKAISKSGFDADDVKADVKAQTKLDGCCKKQ